MKIKFQIIKTLIMWVILTVFLNAQSKESTTWSVTDIDGNTYKAVKIGDQIWMAENLKVTHYRNGDEIPRITDKYEWSKIKNGAYCNYNNIDSYSNIYGRLYNWFAVNDSRGIAPEGWHIPTDQEWMELERYLGMSYTDASSKGWGRGSSVGDKLKEKGSDHWNYGGNNETGFTALPGGDRTMDNSYSSPSSFNDIHDLSAFWTSTEYGLYMAWYRGLGDIRSDVFRYTGMKQYGFSVRCIKNK